MAFNPSIIPDAKRRNLALDSSQITADQANFPLTVKVTDQAFFDELGATASKKLSIEVSGVQCPVEVESESWNASTPIAVLHTKIPTYLAATDTVAVLSFDNSQDDNDSYVGFIGDTVAQSVWSSVHAMVLHPQDPSPGGACILDSTANGNDATPTGMDVSNLVDGLLGKALSFDGSEYLTVIDSASLDLTSAATVLVMYYGTSAKNEGLVSKMSLTGAWTGNAYTLNTNISTLTASFLIGTTPTYASVTVPTINNWEVLAGTYDQSNIIGYANGIAGTPQAYSTAIPTNSYNLSIGRYFNTTSTYTFVGLIAEVRVYNQAMTADWIKLTYLSLTDQLITWSAYSSGASSAIGFSSSGPFPVPVTVRNIVQLPYSLMESIRAIVDMVYGIKLAAIVDLVYGDYPSIKRLVDLRYGDYPIIKKIVDMKYGDLTAIRNLVDIKYDLQESIRAIINLPYHIIQGELRNLVDIDYDLQERDHLKKIVEMIYVIASGETIEEITTLSVVNENGFELSPFHINIEKDEGDPCIRIEIRSNVEDDYEENPELTEIQVTVNSDIYIVLVEEREITSQISEDGRQIEDVYSLKLVSPCMLLDDPYAELISEELSGMASEIAAYVVAKIPAFTYGIEWNLIDWKILPGIFSVTGASPISVLEQLADAAGGIRQSKKDGTLELRPEYPVNIPDYETASPDVYLTEDENFYSVTTINERFKDYNNFLIGNDDPDVNGLDIQYEEISSTQREVRVFQVPWEDDVIQIKTSGGNHVEIRQHGITSLLIEDEEVEIVDGEGSLTFPIYELVSSKYSETNLGTIIPSEDKTINTSIAENTMVFITYNTKFHKFVVKDEKLENVQFWPEIL